MDKIRIEGNGRIEDRPKNNRLLMDDPWVCGVDEGERYR